MYKSADRFFLKDDPQSKDLFESLESKSTQFENANGPLEQISSNTLMRFGLNFLPFYLDCENEVILHSGTRPHESAGQFVRNLKPEFEYHVGTIKALSLLMMDIKEYKKNYVMEDVYDHYLMLLGFHLVNFSAIQGLVNSVSILQKTDLERKTGAFESHRTMTNLKFSTPDGEFKQRELQVLVDFVFAYLLGFGDRIFELYVEPYPEELPDGHKQYQELLQNIQEFKEYIVKNYNINENEEAVAFPLKVEYLDQLSYFKPFYTRANRSPYSKQGIILEELKDRRPSRINLLVEERLVEEDFENISESFSEDVPKPAPSRRGRKPKSAVIPTEIPPIVAEALPEIHNETFFERLMTGGFSD